MPRTPEQLLKHKATQKRYRDRHPDRAVAATKKWIEAHKDQYNEANRKRYHRLKKQISEQRKERRKANPEQFRAYYRTYYKWKSKTSYYRVKALSRIHAARSATGKTSKSAIERLVAIKERGTSCFYCGRNVRGQSANIEHIIPLARGGTNTEENLTVACEHCNKSKHSKMPNEFIRLGQLFLL